MSSQRTLLLRERVRAVDSDHALLIAWTFVFFIRAFHLLVVTDQLRHEIRLRASVLLVAKELAVRPDSSSQTSTQVAGCGKLPFLSHLGLFI